VAATATPVAYHGDEAELYRCHEPELVRSVARKVNASRELRHEQTVQDVARRLRFD